MCCYRCLKEYANNPPNRTNLDHGNSEILNHIPTIDEQTHADSVSTNVGDDLQCKLINASWWNEAFGKWFLQEKSKLPQDKENLVIFKFK